jgi:hypothetical protein
MKDGSRTFIFVEDRTIAIWTRRLENFRRFVSRTQDKIGQERVPFAKFKYYLLDFFFS